MRTSLVLITLLINQVFGRSPYLFQRGLSVNLRAYDGTPSGLISQSASTLSSQLSGGGGSESSSLHNEESTIEIENDCDDIEKDHVEQSDEELPKEEPLETTVEESVEVPNESDEEIAQPIDLESLPSATSNLSEAEDTIVDTDAKVSESISDSIESEISTETSSETPDVLPDLSAEKPTETDDSHAVVSQETSNAVKKLTRKEIRLKKKEERSHQRYARKLKNRNNLNLSRKVLHAGFGIFFAVLNVQFPKTFVPVMATVTTGTLAMELLRYKKNFGWMNDILHFVLGGTMRKHEMEGKFTGSFYYFLGVTVTSTLFTPTCASLGIIQLALADPSASYFGFQTRHVYWSRIENGFFGIGRNKGVLGFLGGALFCFPFNYQILSAAKFGVNGIPGGKQSLAVASIVLGLAGAFADLCVPTPALTMPEKIMGVPMPRFHVDDNVVVPIFSGYACTKIFTSLGWSHSVDLAKFIFK